MHIRMTPLSLGHTPTHTCRGRAQKGHKLYQLPVGLVHKSGPEEVGPQSGHARQQLEHGRRYADGAAGALALALGLRILDQELPE